MGNYIDAEETKTGIDTDGIAWGKAINGLQLGISPPVKLSETHEFDGFEEPVIERDTLQFTVHLRNVGSSDVRFLPTVWDCLAMGDAGAVLVSKLVLTPESGSESLTVTYQGWNHLRLLDKRRPEAASWQETLRKSSPVDNVQLDAKEANDRQIELAAGDAAWPEWVRVSTARDRSTRWRLTEESSQIDPGKYRVTAMLIVDQDASDWKGKLTSGILNVEILPRARQKAHNKHSLLRE